MKKFLHLLIRVSMEVINWYVVSANLIFVSVDVILDVRAVDGTNIIKQYSIYDGWSRALQAFNRKAHQRLVYEHIFYCGEVCLNEGKVIENDLIEMCASSRWRTIIVAWFSGRIHSFLFKIFYQENRKLVIFEIMKFLYK